MTNPTTNGEAIDAALAEGPLSKHELERRAAIAAQNTLLLAFQGLVAQINPAVHPETAQVTARAAQYIESLAADMEHEEARATVALLADQT